MPMLELWGHQVGMRVLCLLVMMHFHNDNGQFSPSIYANMTFEFDDTLMK